MWSARVELAPGGEARGSERVRLASSSGMMTNAEVFEALEHDEGFRRFFNHAVAETKMEAFFWELPRVSEQTLELPFEFVRVPNRALASLEPDPGAFDQHFAESQQLVLAFSNLGGDAELVVPRPCGPTSVYPHLAAFLRGAPAEQQQALWQLAARTLREVLARRPTWLSTAGLGVPWLHLRYDSRPKYYRHLPYRQV